MKLSQNIFVELGLDLEYFVSFTGQEERGKASQKRSEESGLFNGKGNYDRVGFADRLQNNNMLPYHAINRRFGVYETEHTSF